jgi:hypothetical protein
MSGNNNTPKHANVNTDMSHKSTNLMISELIASTILMRCPKNLVTLNIKNTLSQNSIAMMASRMSILKVPDSI